MHHRIWRRTQPPQLMHHLVNMLCEDWSIHLLYPRGMLALAIAPRRPHLPLLPLSHAVVGLFSIVVTPIYLELVSQATRQEACIQGCRKLEEAKMCAAAPKNTKYRVLLAKKQRQSSCRIKAVKASCWY